LKRFLEIKINWKKIKTAAQYWASHSAHGLRCSWVGGLLCSLGQIGTRPGCHDHCGPTSPCRHGALGARSGRSPRMGPPWWHGRRCPDVGQGAGAAVGLAPAGEGEGVGHNCWDGRSPGGRCDGGAGRRRSARQRFSMTRVLPGLRRRWGSPYSSEREKRG
jgi:hypothetical protein